MHGDRGAYLTLVLSVHDTYMKVVEFGPVGGGGEISVSEIWTCHRRSGHDQIEDNVAEFAGEVEKGRHGQVGTLLMCYRDCWRSLGDWVDSTYCTSE